jgi:hypothetical protein
MKRPESKVAQKRDNRGSMLPPIKNTPAVQQNADESSSSSSESSDWDDWQDANYIEEQRAAL